MCIFDANHWSFIVMGSGYPVVLFLSNVSCYLITIFIFFTEGLSFSIVKTQVIIIQ